MTQGMPFKMEEFRLIWSMRRDWPSVVARELSLKYSFLNGGYRNREVVSEVQRDMLNYKTFAEWWENRTIQKEPTQETPKVDLRRKRRKNKEEPQSDI